MKKRLHVLLVGALACVASTAQAQWDPGASHMLGQGMGFSALSSSTLRNSIEATRPEGDKRSQPSTKKQSSSKPAGEPVLRSQADVDRYMKARMLHHAKALEPEYKRREARDGRAAADKWIRARAEELGKMEGERARKLVQRD